MLIDFGHIARLPQGFLILLPSSFRSYSKIWRVEGGKLEYMTHENVPLVAVISTPPESFL